MKSVVFKKQAALFCVIFVCGVLAPRLFYLFGAGDYCAALSPMHIFALTCGFVCGRRYGGVCGFLMPVAAGALFDAPAVYPTAIAMGFEMLAYGYLTGLLRSKIHFAAALAAAMAGGRLLYLAVRLLLGAMYGGAYSLTEWFGEMFLTGWPSIVCSFAVVGTLIFTLKKTGIVRFDEND